MEETDEDRERDCESTRDRGKSSCNWAGRTSATFAFDLGKFQVGPCGSATRIPLLMLVLVLARRSDRR